MACSQSSFRGERSEEETETPHHLPGRPNAHSTWALGPATSGLRFRRRLLRKAQCARPRSMCALAGSARTWSHSHILSTMARRRACGADDGTCSALLHHVAAVRRRRLAMSTAHSPVGSRAPTRTAHQYRGAVISCAVAQCALTPCKYATHNACACAQAPFKCQIFFLAFAKRFSNT